MTQKKKLLLLGIEGVSAVSECLKVHCLKYDNGRCKDKCVAFYQQEKADLRAKLEAAEDEKYTAIAIAKNASKIMTDLEQDRDNLQKRFTAPIVCMCGSTKFKQTWIAENARLTLAGNIVLSVGMFGHADRQMKHLEDNGSKIKLDDLHKRKIDLCDWVWVLDVGGYIGESTRSEITYAEKLGKPVRYLSQEFPDYIEPGDNLQAQVAAIYQDPCNKYPGCGYCKECDNIPQLRKKNADIQAQVGVLRGALESIYQLSKWDRALTMYEGTKIYSTARDVLDKYRGGADND